MVILKKNNLLDKTIIVITSDHGEEFKEHGGLLHGETLYEEMVKVPLIIYLPGKKSGKRISSQVSIIDIMPTILGKIGIKKT